jgi:hypothetical protein
VLGRYFSLRPGTIGLAQRQIGLGWPDRPVRRAQCAVARLPAARRWTRWGGEGGVSTGVARGTHLTRQGGVRLTGLVLSGLVLFARYIRAPKSLRYEYSAPNTSSLSYFDLNESVSFFKPQTIMGVLMGYALSILNSPILSWHKQISV